jgi:hypothetical protein
MMMMLDRSDQAPQERRGSQFFADTYISIHTVNAGPPNGGGMVRGWRVVHVGIDL